MKVNLLRCIRYDLQKTRKIKKRKTLVSFSAASLPCRLSTRFSLYSLLVAAGLAARSSFSSFAQFSPCFAGCFLLDVLSQVALAVLWPFVVLHSGMALVLGVIYTRYLLFPPRSFLLTVALVTGMPTRNFEQISQAVVKCHKMGVKQVLVKLGEKGSAWFVEGKEPIHQPIIPDGKVLDTTGAGDTFTAAFVVVLVEDKSRKECMRFATAAASLCVLVKGAIPSMTDRKSVVKLLQSL